MSQELMLSPGEFYMAAHVGLMRQVKARQLGLSDYKSNRTRDPSQLWGQHIEGACAEFAVSTVLNLCWKPKIGIIGEPDFMSDGGVGIEVRLSSRHDGPLIVRPSDDEKFVFVLVTGRAPCLTIVGFCEGAFGKSFPLTDPQDRGQPCHEVPQSSLREMERIPI